MASFTVTAAESGTTFPGVLLQVMVLTSAAGPGNTATQSGAAAHQATITITGAGSRVYYAAANASISAFSGASNLALLHDQADSPNGLETATAHSSSATTGAGSLLCGFSTPTAAGGAALLEITPSGTITEDASSPAAVYSGSSSTAATTASFSPPLRSLLVAMVAADASTATVLGLSDTSGLGLAWTQQVVSQTTGNLYSGVWTAQMPAPAAVAAPVLGGGKSMLARRLALADL